MPPSRSQFLKDVLQLSWTAFGGPNAHIALMLDLLVKRRKYLDEEELIELIALCQLLPGPTSTQTLTAIGYRIGGPALAALTISLWIIPAFCLMSAISIAFNYIPADLDHYVRFLPPMALALIAQAGWKIGHKTIKTNLTAIIFLLALTAGFAFRSPLAPMLIVLIGGLLTAFLTDDSASKAASKVYKGQWHWTFLVVFMLIFGATYLLPEGKLEGLFQSFYRYGSLIFGGGQVLLPFIYQDLVVHLEWLQSDRFLTGYSLVQLLPGPVFSFSAFAGSETMVGSTIGMHLVGALTACLGVFLPGFLLICWMIPTWSRLRRQKIFSAAVAGLSAAGAGLIGSAILLIGLRLDWNPQTILAFLLSMIFIFTGRLPVFWWIAALLLAGFLL